MKLTKIAAPRAVKVAAGREVYAIAIGPAAAVDIAAIARELPDADDVPPGAVVVILPGGTAPSLTTRLLAALGRGKTVPRSLRSTALVARGYVGVAGAIDETLGDLAWGHAPIAAPSAEADSGDDDDD